MKPKKIELYFNTAYLLTAFVLGCLLLSEKKSFAWGVMALVLALGDSTHLIPRISQIVTEKKNLILIGYGKMITSITMSLFYTILWLVGINLFTNSYSSVPIYVLCVTRIILCLLPQNKWTSEKPSYSWGIYRNIPFLLQGILVFFLFYLNRDVIPAIHYTYLGIFLSFLFYIPVVLWAHKKPILGMLMLPKTICYVWIIAMGFYL